MKPSALHNRPFAFAERRQCPLCESTRGRPLFQSGFGEGAIGQFIESYYRIDPMLFGNAQYELMECEACTLVYQRFVGGNRLLGTLYGEWIGDSNRPEQDPSYQSEVAAPLQSRDGHEILVAAAFLRKSPHDMQVLDFGMGWALWARIARQLGCDAFGQELPRARLDFAKRHDIVPIDIEELKPRQFDFINTEQVMEHVSELWTTARQLAECLQPGGILKISVPNAEAAWSIAAALAAGQCKGTIEELMPVHPLEHVNSFTRRSLRVLAHRLGLTIVRPPLWQRYAFLKKRGSISIARPRKAVKELIRPVYQYHNRTNLYVWMQKPGVAGS